MSTPLAIKPEPKEMAPFGEFNLLRRFSREMDRLFEDFGFKPALFDRPMTTSVWMPEVDVLERNGTLLVRADLPGLTKEDVKVNVVENLLTIEGERKEETESKQDGYIRSERSYGTFYRSLPLPVGVKPEKIEATFKNGVLEVSMPLTAPEKKTKEIEIK